MYGQALIVGNVYEEIALSYTKSGTAVAEVHVSVIDRKKDGDEWVEETSVVPVTVWGKQAESASEYLSEGSPVLFNCKVKMDTWEYQGKDRSKLRLVASNMQFLGGKK